MHVIKVLGEPGREYKDRVFRMLLKKPEVALEVYNAMNDTAYEDPDELTITTLENAVYIGMKNDVSFVIASQLVLYEHQSTVNKNMPLRNLIYVTCIYSALTRNENLYGRKMIPLPEPKFVVFYNGRENIQDRTEGRLSDAYERISGEPDLDLKITILNINEEHIRQEREESWEEGMEQGREEGTLLKLVQQTLKKIQKGWTAERIAELLEEDLSVIKRICDIAKKYEPDYQESMICSELFLQKNN